MSTLEITPAVRPFDGGLDYGLDRLLDVEAEPFPYEYRGAEGAEEWQPLRSWEHAAVLLSRLGTASFPFIVFQHAVLDRCAQVFGDHHLLSLELLHGSAVYAVLGDGHIPGVTITGSNGETASLGPGESLNAREAHPVARAWLTTASVLPPWRLRELTPSQLTEMPRIGQDD